MINELLLKGKENARTGKELAEALGCDIRAITAQIERERRDGCPICADTTGGYYLPQDTDELYQYCNRLQHRANELYITRQALVSVLMQLLPDYMGQQSLFDDGPEA